MKKFLFLLSSILLLFACNQPEQKANKLLGAALLPTIADGGWTVALFEQYVGKLTTDDAFWTGTKKDNVKGRHFKNMLISRSTIWPDSYGWSNDTFTNCLFKDIPGKCLALYGAANIVMNNVLVINCGSGPYFSTCTNVKVDHLEGQKLNGPAYPLGTLIQFNFMNGGGVLTNFKCWNPVAAADGQGAEDVINFHMSNNMVVDGGYIKGGGPSKSGGGVNIADGGGSGNTAKNIILINPGQYGAAIVSGSNNTLENIRIWGKKQVFSNRGFLYWRAGSAAMGTNNKFINTEVYWVMSSGANGNYWTDGSAGLTRTNWKETNDPNGISINENTPCPAAYGIQAVAGTVTPTPEPTPTPAPTPTPKVDTVRIIVRDTIRIRDTVTIKAKKIVTEKVIKVYDQNGLLMKQTNATDSTDL